MLRTSLFMLSTTFFSQHNNDLGHTAFTLIRGILKVLDFAYKISRNPDNQIYSFIQVAIDHPKVVMASDLDTLIDMGFEKQRAEMAVRKTGGCMLLMFLI